MKNIFGCFKLVDNYDDIDVIFAAEATESNEIDIRRWKHFSFQMPSAWTAATLQIKGTLISGGTVAEIQNEANVVFPAMTVSANGLYVIDLYSLYLAGMSYVKFVSSVAQEAERTIKLMCKA